MVVYNLLVRGLIAVAIGALVGLEREHHSKDTLVLAGARTYPLVALMGFFTAYLSTGENPQLPYMVHIGFLITALLAGAQIYIRFKLGHFGITSEMAIIMTFISGALLGIGEGLVTPYTTMAVFISVIMTFLLIEKSKMHELAKGLSSSEITGAAEFLLILFVLYPIAIGLNGAIDPYGLVGPNLLFDPGYLLSVVIIVSIITFTSFIFIKKFGGFYGVIISGFFGGLMSSEATTISLANLAKNNREKMNVFSSSILLTLVSLFLKDFIVVWLLDPGWEIVQYIAIPFVIMFVIVSLMAYIPLHSRKLDIKEDIEYPSPFALKLAVGFAVIVTIVTAATFLLTNAFGSYGLMVISVGGLVSSLAVVASVVHQFAIDPSLDPRIIASAIIVSAGFAVMNKIAITFSVYRPIFRRLLVPLIIIAIITFLTAAMPLMGISI